MYMSIFSLPRLLLGLSDQLHALPALLPVNEPSLPVIHVYQPGLELRSLDRLILEKETIFNCMCCKLNYLNRRLFLRLGDTNVEYLEMFIILRNVEVEYSTLSYNKEHDLILELAIGGC
jgi:hypothetical protein